MHWAGDVAAGRARPDMQDIAREHYDAVYRFCARRVGPDRAADVAQETFITAQCALSKFRGESNIRTWMFGIALNECRRAVRKQSRESFTIDYAIDMAGAAVTEDSIVDREILRAALRELSDEHREAVLLHEMEGLTYEEAAEILDVPVGTVKSRLHHAFINLRRAVKPAGGGENAV